MSNEHMNTDETQESTQTQEHEKIIVVENETAAQMTKGLSAIDYSTLTDKQLMEFEKKELLELAQNEKVLKDLKAWQIQRLSKKDIIKKLRSKTKPQEKKEVKESSNNEQDTEDIILLQGAIIDVLASGNAEKLDIYCAKVLQNNDSELIDQDQAEKIKKFMTKFALVHLIIRKNLGGYKIIFGKAKNYFQILKEKYQEKKNAA